MKKSNIQQKIVSVTLFLLLCGIVLNAYAQDANDSAKIIGRPVTIISICFNGKTLEQITGLVEQEAVKGVDMIVLPELCTGSRPETLDGTTIKTMSRLAGQNRCYIVCPISRREGEFRFNSAVLIDRQGKVVCVYDKIYPYFSEFNSNDPVTPAQKDVQVYETDFGKVGFAICFDAKFPEVWQRLRDTGADIVVWPSAYSGGTELQAYALMHHYYILTSTWTGDCLVHDFTGRPLLDKPRDNDVTVARITIDMDRRIYHYNFNQGKLKKLLAEHGDEIECEIDMPREEWFVLKAKKPGVSVRKLAGQYELEELRDYKERSRNYMDEKRGFQFTGKFGGYPGK